MKSLVVIDVQREYTTPGRLFNIKSIDASLGRARTMLQHARAEGWPIVHVQHLRDGQIFNPNSEMSDFVEGFTPNVGEGHAIKEKYSSFSSQEFSNFVAGHADREFLVVGYGTTMCCLSTIVEGYHKGFRFALVEDACAARAAGDLSEESMHKHAAAILGTFARITTTDSETGSLAH